MPHLLAYFDPTGGLPPSQWGVFIASIVGAIGVALAGLKLWGRVAWAAAVHHRRTIAILLLSLIAGGMVGVVAFFNRPKPLAEPRAATPAARRRVVVLALDGLDPNLVDQFLADGRLPNLARLARDGTYHRLGTTTPPQSPVAWSSFITAQEPAAHGVFDFIRRNPKNYFPDTSIADRIGERLPWKGKPFWDAGAIHDLDLVALRMPLTFPAPRLNGRLLAGMGVWDVRGTAGTYAYFSTKPVKDDDARGLQLPLVEDGAVLRGELPGPYTAGKTDGVTEPFEIVLDGPQAAGGKTHAVLKMQGKEYPLVEGRWSGWIGVEFRSFGIKGLTRAILHHTAEKTTLYVSPINLDPAEPKYVISYPKQYAAELDGAIGHFHTRGMPFDFQALKDGVVSDDEFLAQCGAVTDETERMLFHELPRCPSGMLFAYFETPDIIQHMFWRTIDPENALYGDADSAAHRTVIADHYHQLDAIVGRVRAAMGDGGTLLVISDHGFAPFRRGVHLTAVLRDLGYLALLPGVASSPDFFKGVDWSKTRAYALGLNAVYLNRAGREGQGVVPPQDAAALAREIAAKLEAFVDPANGARAIKVVNLPDAGGAAASPDMPDLIVGYARGYRASWATGLGGVPLETTGVNTSKWSGDHCIAPDEVPGVFFSSDAALTAPTLMAVAPAINAFLSGK
jgi:predicted AlkP superfamily phosphohydrolase/phosphomutase